MQGLSDIVPLTILSALFVHVSQADRASEYLNIQATDVQSRIRIVHSEASSASLPVQKANPFETVLDMERKFGPWIAAELKEGSQRYNGIVVAPPTWIIENHINGGVSLASKDTHGLPVISWWVGPAASLIRRVIAIKPHCLGSNKSSVPFRHIGNTKYGHGGRLLERIAQILEQDGLTNGTTVEDLYKQVSAVNTNYQQTNIRLRWNRSYLNVWFAYLASRHTMSTSRFRNSSRSCSPLLVA